MPRVYKVFMEQERAKGSETGKNPEDSPKQWAGQFMPSDEKEAGNSRVSGCIRGSDTDSGTGICEHKAL